MAQCVKCEAKVNNMDLVSISETVFSWQKICNPPLKRWPGTSGSKCCGSCAQILAMEIAKSHGAGRCSQCANDDRSSLPFLTSRLGLWKAMGNGSLSYICSTCSDQAKSFHSPDPDRWNRREGEVVDDPFAIYVEQDPDFWERTGRG